MYAMASMHLCRCNKLIKIQLKGEEKKKREIWMDLQHANRRTFRKLEKYSLCTHMCRCVCVYMCTHSHSINNSRKKETGLVKMKEICIIGKLLNYQKSKTLYLFHKGPVSRLYTTLS